MSRPRIVILANSIEEVGGAQRVVHVLAQGFADRGYPVDRVGGAPHPYRHEFVTDPGFRRFTLMPEPW
ncbi:MAG: glycosyltransferase family 4 protein, partial [Actinomycetes bacterium]